MLYRSVPSTMIGPLNAGSNYVPQPKNPQIPSQKIASRALIKLNAQARDDVQVSSQEVLRKDKILHQN